MQSNLYFDLGFDSLSFVYLLLDVEKMFSIKFELMQMQECLFVGRLIELTVQKVRETIYD